MAPESELQILDAAGRLSFISGFFSYLGRTSPEALRFVAGTVTGAARKTDFMIYVGTNGQTIIRVAAGEVDLTNAPPFSDTLHLTNNQAALASGGTNLQLIPSPKLDVRVRKLGQTFLYYPGLFDLNELGGGLRLEASLTNSIRAYAVGDLRRALALYPTNRIAASNPERLYLASLLLTVGDYQGAKSLVVTNLSAAEPDSARHRRLAGALQQVMAAAEGWEWVRPNAPNSATEWLAESYYQQSRAGLPFDPNAWEQIAYAHTQNALERALVAAKNATPAGSTFEFGWVRRAELEFGFGRINEAIKDLRQAGAHQQGNAQAVALAGFLSWATNNYRGALAQFQKAAALDDRLGHAWLGIGLTELREENVFAFFRQGRPWDYWKAKPDSEGLRHLESAAASEPERSLLRSYLAKAYYDSGGVIGDPFLLKSNAFQQVELARRLDTNDPTPHLYSALINHQENRVNAAVRELEQSIELNDNRAVYRSRLLLDQDRAVRSANLAAIYRDAGLVDVSVREAARSTGFDYANYSSHLFLADSFYQLRDPRGVNLRFETPAVNELLLAHLLQPVGAGPLSANVSQLEFSRLFDRDRLGLFSFTRYTDNGDWTQLASQFGNVDGVDYAVDARYLFNNGSRQNNESEETEFDARLKLRLTRQDSLLLQVDSFDSSGGDLRQLADPSEHHPDFHFEEHRSPAFLAGWHREWNPQNHTLLVGTYLPEELRNRDFNQTMPVFRTKLDGMTILQPIAGRSPRSDYDLRTEMEIYSLELQHIWRQEQGHTTILGGRLQGGEFEAQTELAHIQERPGTMPPIYSAAATNVLVHPGFDRQSLYAYQDIHFNHFVLIAGVSYDHLHFPANPFSIPAIDEEDSKDRLSPKAGFIWNLSNKASLRGVYTRSLGGVSLDQNIRIEPTQVAGFVQTYRSLVPESVAGSIAAPVFETADLSLDGRIGESTFFGLTGEWLRSKGDLTEGRLVARTTNVVMAPVVAVFNRRGNFSFEEPSFAFDLGQLLAEEWSIAARYKVSRAELERDFGTLQADTPREDSGLLHQLDLNLLFNHHSGVFSAFQALWRAQSNLEGDGKLDNSAFWQFNWQAGYRLPKRRAEISIGILNLTDQRVKMSPINLAIDLPAKRLVFASLKLEF